MGALADARPEQPELTVRLRDRHERLPADRRHRVVDEAARHNLALSLAVLAGYEELTAQLGAGFQCTHPHDDHDHYVAQVERCDYHQVLQANGAPHLTPAFCAFDGMRPLASTGERRHAQNMAMKGTDGTSGTGYL